MFFGSSPKVVLDFFTTHLTYAATKEQETNQTILVQRSAPSVKYTLW